MKNKENKMNRILDYSGFTNLIYLNENDVSGNEITRKEVAQKLHDGMYNFVQKIAYGENQREKNNPKYAWVKYLIPKIWNEVDLMTNPNDGSFVTQENTYFAETIQNFNNCNIKVEIPKGEIEKIKFKSINDLKNFIATSNLSQESRKTLLEVVKPLENEFIEDFVIPLDSDDAESFMNLPGIKFFHVEGAIPDGTYGNLAKLIGDHFNFIMGERLKKIFYEIFKNKFLVSSEEIIKPEPSDTMTNTKLQRKPKSKSEYKPRVEYRQSEFKPEYLNNFGY